MLVMGILLFIIGVVIAIIPRKFSSLQSHIKSLQLPTSSYDELETWWETTQSDKAEIAEYQRQVNRLKIERDGYKKLLEGAYKQLQEEARTKKQPAILEYLEYINEDDIKFFKETFERQRRNYYYNAIKHDKHQVDRLLEIRDL